jgi:hypothetical protein
VIGVVILAGGLMILSHNIEKRLISEGHLLASKLVDKGMKGSIIFLGGMAIVKAIMVFL